MTVKIFAFLVSLTAGIAVSAQADELAEDAALAVRMPQAHRILSPSMRFHR